MLASRYVALGALLTLSASGCTEDDTDASLHIQLTAESIVAIGQIATLEAHVSNIGTEEIAPRIEISFEEGPPGGEQPLLTALNPSCAVAGMEIRCPEAPIAPGSTRTVTARAVFGASPEGGTFDVRARAEAPDNAVQSSRTIEVIEGIHVAVVDLEDPVSLGDPLRYEVTLENVDFDPSYAGVEATLYYDEGEIQELDEVPLAVSSPSIEGINRVIVDLSDELFPGDVVTLEVEGNVENAPDANPLPFHVLVAPKYETGVLGSAVEETTMGVPQPGDVVDLEIAVVDEPDPVAVGAQMSFAIAVSNDGPDDAYGVAVVGELASDIEGLSASDECTIDDELVVCELGFVPAGTTIALVILAEPSGTDFGQSLFYLELDGEDANPDDNSVDVETTLVGPTADLSVTVTDSADPIGATFPLDFEVTIHNAGPSEADVYLEADFYTGYQVFGVTREGGACEILSSNAAECFPDTMAADTSWTVTFTGQAYGTPGMKTSTFEVSSDASDPTPADNVVDETTLVE